MASPSKPLAERIREFTLRTFIQPAVRANKREITIRAGDIHSAMRLRDRMPAVCSALESRKFQDMCGLELVSRKGPHRGANVFLTFGRGKSTRRPNLPQSSKPQTPSQSPRTPRKTAQIKADPNALYLVACVKTKRKSRAAAKDLYVSSLFTKARAYVESKGGRWRILSAKHGLVHPDKVIGPYELTLNRIGVADRRKWAADVLEALLGVKPQPKQMSPRGFEYTPRTAENNSLAMLGPSRDQKGEGSHNLTRLLVNLAWPTRHYGDQYRFAMSRNPTSILVNGKCSKRYSEKT
jgi:hypothetical protein